MVVGLILAWFLSLFGFDEICINALFELFGVTVTVATYYFIFALLGLIFKE